MSFLHQHTRRAHSLLLTSCPECRAAARWRWDEQKEEKKKEESPSRHRRREERGERRRVLWGRENVYDRHELRWGGREWWQQVRVRKCLCMHNRWLVTMNGSYREQGGLLFCQRTAASQKLKQCLGDLSKSDLANCRKMSSDRASLAEKQTCLLDTRQESVLFPQRLLGPPLRSPCSAPSFS